MEDELNTYKKIQCLSFSICFTLRFFFFISCLSCAYISLYYLPQLSGSKKNGAQKKNKYKHKQRCTREPSRTHYCRFSRNDEHNYWSWNWSVLWLVSSTEMHQQIDIAQCPKHLIFFFSLVPSISISIRSFASFLIHSINAKTLRSRFVLVL